MAIIWGTLEPIHEALTEQQWIEARTVLPGGLSIRVRAMVSNDTTIARGIARVNLADLRKGELVEVTYHKGDEEFFKADTIYVLPDPPDQRRDCIETDSMGKVGL